MTIADVISLLRGLIKEHDSSVGVYTDQRLWKIFSIARAKMLSQKLKKFQHINPQNYNTFCMPMELTDSYTCTCVDVPGCQVLRSIHPLPRTICGRNNCELYVSTLGNKLIDPINQQDFTASQSNPIFANNVLHSLVDNHIIIWNPPQNYPVIQVKALWENIEAWDDIQHCPDSNSSCSVFNMDTGIDEDMVMDSILMVINLLRVPQSIPDDVTGDSSDALKN